MIPHIRRIHTRAKIIYRSHIHLETGLMSNRSTPQSRTWRYLYNFIKKTDLFVSHPVPDFIPDEVPKKKIVLMPATTDPLDGLNKLLTQPQMDYYLSLFDEILTQGNQRPLDRRRPVIIQIARFDPSKGIIDVIEAYRALRVRLEKERRGPQKIPQLVIVGHGAVDDPEGIPILTETMHMLTMYRYRKYAYDVKVARVPHSDQLLNALLRTAHVALQLSYKEGFEVKVTEAIAKGKPVIAYKTGGIPLQIEQGKTGYLVEVGDTYQVSEHLYRLFTDERQYRIMSAACERRVRSEFFTVSNAAKWLYLANQLITAQKINEALKRPLA